MNTAVISERIRQKRKAKGWTQAELAEALGMSEMTDVKISAGVTEHRLSDVTDRVSELRETVNDLKGDVKALSAKIDTMQNKVGWYISLLGIGLTVVIALVQVLVK